MTDINSPLPPPAPDAGLARRFEIELLFFAYRDFTAEADAILTEYGFGRAHHRVIYFVGRHPGIPVSELLDILRITKQSLARVLGQLITEGFVEQRPGPRDRRQRLLALTPRGEDLERRLTGRQGDRIRRAAEQVGEAAADGFRRMMLELVEPADRGRFAAFLEDEGNGRGPSPGGR